MSREAVVKEFNAFSRLCRLWWYFKKDNGSFNPFRIRNPDWNPLVFCPELENALDVGRRILEDRIMAIVKSSKPRFTLKQLIALRRLKKLPIFIKPTDKNLGLAILDRDKYIAEGLRQLSDPLVYQEVPFVHWVEIQRCLLQLKARYRHQLSVGTWKYLNQIDSVHARACTLYFIWKVQKDPPVGQPICSYNGFMLEPLSKYLHFQLLDILLSQENHLLDSLALLQVVENQRFPFDCLLVTFDVESLYPSISIQEGLVALKDMLMQQRVKFFTPEIVDFLVDAAELVLRWNFLEFNGKFYRQIRGTAMGSN
eukprot:Gb_00020 [translate_table: standard]